MNITLSPVRSDIQLEAFVSGDVLTLNGVALDFTPLPPGATLPREAIDNSWIAGDVTRDTDGTLTVPLILPHGPNAPQETRFPSPLVVTNGPVPLPPHDAPQEALNVD